MNLHDIVRGGVTTVNPDIPGILRQSTGFTVDPATGRPVPAYTDYPNVPLQVQALSSKDLKHVNYLGIQGVRRSVYMYGNTQGINRPNAEGGDLLIFPEQPGAAPQTWLVAIVFETWPDWCRVGVTLQTDPTET
jgi:hypothetical protein